MISKRKVFEKQMQDKLLSIGYKHTRWNRELLYYLIRTDEIKETIYFMFSHGYQGNTEINTVTGVCYDSIENTKRILLELENIKQPLSIPTIKENIFIRIPKGEYGRWTLSDIDNIPTVCDGIISEINEYGHYFYSKYGKIDNLRIGLENTNNTDFCWDDRKFNLPIIYYLTGQKDKGFRFINDMLSSSKKAYADAYEQRFINNYFKL